MELNNQYLTEDEVRRANFKGFNTKLALTDLTEKVNEMAEKMQYLTKHEHNKALSAHDKLAYFFSYEKSRMDFLADIATLTPTMESSKMLYGELLAGIDKNRILLDRISGIDDFKYTIKLRDCRNNKEGKEISLENDFSVAIPNDIIGQHAFYIIIENLIRNTAKHAGNSGQDFITFNIEVHESQCPQLSRYYEVHIYDDINVIEKVKFHEDDIKFFKDCGVKEFAGMDVQKINLDNINGEDEEIKIDKLQKLVCRQNCYINENILDSDNKLRQGAWGMIEMEAAAGYLRKIPVESIDEEKYNLLLEDLEGNDYGKHVTKDCSSANILKAFIKTNGDNRHLAYRFFMLKPKEILVVVDDAAVEKIQILLNNSSTLNDFSFSLLNYGIWLKYKGEKQPNGIDKLIEETKDKDGKVVVNAEICEHEILLDLTDAKIKPNIGVLADRIVHSPTLVDELGKINCKDGATNLKEKVWTEFRIQLPNIFIHNYTPANRTYLFKDISKPRIEANYDHHARVWSTQLFSKFPADYQYLEVTTGLNNLTVVLDKAASKVKENGCEIAHNSDEIIYTKLLSSIDCEVIVLDERVQQAAYRPLYYYPEATENGHKPDPIPFHELYFASGIYVPQKDDFDFSRISYSGKKDGKNAIEQIKCLLRNIGRIKITNDKTVSFQRIKFLVVHLGVLEKILNVTDKKKSDPKLERDSIRDLVNQLKDALPEAIRQKVKPVIISGRGLPPNLPSDVPYVNFSSISQYLIDNRNKYLLNELLHSTRNINNNEL